MMRMVVAAMAAGVVLAGCGSSGQSAESSAPVESASASGAVASAEECPANSPVRGILKGDVGWASYNGVFGHIYNTTGSPLWVWSQRKDAGAPCLLNPGKGASFGFAGPPKEEATWVPRHDFLLVSNHWILFLVTSSAASDAPGTMIGVFDPDIGYPNAASIYRTAGGSSCEGDDVGLETDGLSEGQEYRLKGNSQGSVLVKRLDDNEVIAREWMQTSDADDWARLDLYVESIGRC